jgi:hypothetical protein
MTPKSTTRTDKKASDEEPAPMPHTVTLDAYTASGVLDDFDAWSSVVAASYATVERAVESEVRDR